MRNRLTHGRELTVGVGDALGRPGRTGREQNRRISISIGSRIRIRISIRTGQEGALRACAPGRAQALKRTFDAESGTQRAVQHSHAELPSRPAEQPGGGEGAVHADQSRRGAGADGSVESARAQACIRNHHDRAHPQTGVDQYRQIDSWRNHQAHPGARADPGSQQASRHGLDVRCELGPAQRPDDPSPGAHLGYGERAGSIAGGSSDKAVG